jgi:hypothetical protein
MALFRHCGWSILLTLKSVPDKKADLVRTALSAQPATDEISEFESMIPLIAAAAAGTRSRSGGALRVLLAGATLAAKSDGKDRAGGRTGRERKQ